MVPEQPENNHDFWQSPEIVRTILEYAPDAVITIDGDGFIMSWNPQAELLFGWKENEVIGKTLPDTIIPLRYHELHKEGIKRFKALGEGPVMNKPIEIFALRKDKSEFPVELKISFSKIDQRYVFIGFVRDITVRRKSEEIIRKKTAQLEEAQQLAHIGSWEWDIKTNKIEWSDELYRIFGLVPQEFESNYEHYLSFIHPEDREYVNETVQKAVESLEPYQFHHRLVRKDGLVRTISSTGKVLVDENNHPVRMAGTAQDITKQKQHELQLKEKNFQLEKMNKELQSFAYVSSHDLQEPLRKIRMFSDRILESENLTDHGKDYFQRMQDAAIRMQQLIDDLLSYSRASSDERSFESTDLNELFDHVMAGFKELIAEKNATILKSEMCHARVIPFQFQQLLSNLLGNSLKFSRPGIPPFIEVTSRIFKNQGETTCPFLPGVEYCHIRIKDNGIGFDNTYKEKIFEVFQRLHGRESFSGTGIGLSIVKKIVENHNGVITATGEPDKGATFDIYIPHTPE